MNEGLYDHLASFGFKKFDHRTIELIWGMKSAQLVGFAKSAEAATRYADQPSKSPFEFSASLTFAGDASPCSTLDCRLKRVEELAYFTSLYADRVLVASLFPSIDPEWPIDRLRREVAAAVASTLHFKPLVTAGLIEYTHHDHCHVCLNCYAELAGKSAEDWHRLRSELEREYRERVKYYLVRDEFGTYALPDGPDDLFDEHSTTPLKGISPSLLKFAPARKHGRWPIPAPVIDELRLPQGYASHVAVDILGRDFAASRFGTGYLTRREIDLRLITSTVKDAQADAILDRGLSHEVPVLDGITPENLLKLRHDEADAFKNYQSALRQAAIQSAEDGQADLAEIFRDVVEPEIRRMNEALKSARNTLVRGLAADVAGATAYVSIALFGGIITPGIAAALAALGGVHFTDKIADKVSKLVNQEPEKARENQFYFLWKASQMVSRKKAKR